MAKASMVLFMVLMLACRSVPPAAHVWPSNGEATRTTIEALLKRDPLAPDQNIRVTNLGSTESISHHLIQIRRGETLHIHPTHDLTIFAYRGGGMMILGTNEFSVVTGDVLFVPRGIRHQFTNVGKDPAIAVVVFSPALIGKDFEEIPAK